MKPAAAHPTASGNPGEAMATVRPVRLADVETVVALWADNARESFPEVLSYDRWGPGVPVPYDDDIVEANVMAVDPLEAVRSQLTARVNHPAAFCLLAEINRIPVGFITASLLPASALEQMPQIGAIEQLHVLPHHRRRGVGTRLVAAATGLLREHGAVVFRVHVNPDFTGALRFWDKQPHWTHDARAYHCYD